MTIIARHSYSEGASDPKARALQEALRKLEKAKAALQLIRITDDGPSGDRAERALKELDDATE